jgi:hypothetical protein
VGGEFAGRVWEASLREVFTLFLGSPTWRMTRPALRRRAKNKGRNAFARNFPGASHRPRIPAAPPSTRGAVGVNAVSSFASGQLERVPHCPDDKRCGDDAAKTARGQLWRKSATLDDDADRPVELNQARLQQREREIVAHLHPTLATARVPT